MKLNLKKSSSDQNTQPVDDSAQLDSASSAKSNGSTDAFSTTESHQVGKYKVDVIRDKCISAASCVAIAPGTFDLDEEGIAIILSQTGDDPETQLLAAQSCPTAAIVITDTETGEQVWPK